MARLKLLLDYSPDFYWLAATFHQNRQLLSDFNISIAPFNSWRVQPVPTHFSLWNLAGSNSSKPQYYLDILDKIEKLLESGQDVLLFSNSAKIQHHNAFNNLIKSRFSPYGVDLMAIFGRPVIQLEQAFRLQNRQPAQKYGVDISKDLGVMPAIAAYERDSWGEENITFLANLSRTGKACPNPAITARVFSWLGIAQQPKMAPVQAQPLFYGSSSARRLNRARMARLNKWPPIDDAQYNESLAKCDALWGEEFSAPLALRKSFTIQTQDSVSQLEELLKLEAGSLGAPEAFLETAEVLYDAPLPGERLCHFAAELSEEVKQPLLQRFNNDRNILTPDQLALADAISPGFSKLEEVSEQPLLTVLTMTYNHEKYIGQCIESVLAQKTSFPVRHLVLDHCSTDATPEIIAKYARDYPTVRPILLSGRAHPENVTGLFIRCRSKYAALCDGDDYFTEPLKLQKQVDFLESNPDCSVCFHPVLVHFDNGEKEDFIFPPANLLPKGNRKKYYLTDLLKNNMIQTNSAVYRWRFTDGLPKWFDATLCPGDWYWHILHAETGKIAMIPELMSVYRRHENALYNNAFKDRKANRRKTGMQELNALKVINEHFNKRYDRLLKDAATGVFDDYATICLEQDDPSFLQAAIKKFPDFWDYYLSQIRTEQGEK